MKSELEFTQLFKRLVKIYQGVDLDESFTLNTGFAEVGLGSVEILGTLGDIEEEEGVEFPDNELYELTSLADLYSIYRRLKAGC